MASFNAAQQLAQNDPRYYDDEALALLALGKPGRAVVQATEAINLDPRFWYSHYALAEIAHTVGNHALAQQQASATILWAPIAYPPPPAAQLAAMRKLARTG
jgi:Tfp pilus assembly protein PilF